jgi:DNA-binding NarL/FixJ family response regulator
LYVGEETVKSHLKSIYRKLGVSSRGEAIEVAFSGAELRRAETTDDEAISG